MSEWVLDASAVLAWLQDEPGAGEVEPLMDGGVVSAANWSELLVRVRARDRDAEEVATLLSAYGLTVVPVTREDAELAAQLWRAEHGLSLGDRLCLATARMRGAVAVTTDRRWADVADELGVGVQLAR